jgi:hypothetical protein
VSLFLSGCFGPDYPDGEAALSWLRETVSRQTPNHAYSIDSVSSVDCKENEHSSGHFCVLGVVLSGDQVAKFEVTEYVSFDVDSSELIAPKGPFILDLAYFLENLIASKDGISGLPVRAYQDLRIDEYNGEQSVSAKLEIRTPYGGSFQKAWLSFVPKIEEGRWVLEAVKQKTLANRDWTRGQTRLRIFTEDNGQGKIEASVGGDRSQYYFKVPSSDFDLRGDYISIGKLLSVGGVGLLSNGDYNFGPSDYCQFRLMDSLYLAVSGCSKYPELNGSYF